MELYRIVIVGVITFLGLNLYGQEDAEISRVDRRELAGQHIRQMKEGALAVRLISERKKIEELEQQAKAQPDNQRIARELANTKEYRDAFNREWMQELISKYNFSKLYFFYDYDSRQLKDDVRSGYFLNSSLQVDPTITIERPYIYVLSEGTAGSSGIAAFMVYDQKFQLLDKPFPYYFKKNNFWKVVFGIFDSKSSRHRNLDKIANEIQESFIEFYKNSIAL